MRLPQIGLVALTAATLLCCGPSLAAAAAPRVSVPISQVRSADGVILYTVPVEVGGTTIDALLDSGSVGLRILAAALPQTSYTATTQPATMQYANGVHLGGLQATADVAFGTLSANVPIQVVQTVDCVVKQPKCPVAADAKDKADQLWTGALKAIVGISLPAPGFSAPISNPLPSLGDAWIVVLPRPGSPAAGQLIINPDVKDLAGFVDFPAGTGEVIGAARANPIPGCIKNEGNGKSFCGPVVLDSGNPEVTVITNAFADARVWNAGSKVELSFTEPSGSVLSAAFTVQPEVFPTRVRLGPFPNIGQPPTRILAGAEPYFAFEVLYDAKDKLIGLKAR